MKDDWTTEVTTMKEEWTTEVTTMKADWTTEVLLYVAMLMRHDLLCSSAPHKYVLFYGNKLSAGHATGDKRKRRLA